MAAGLLFGTRAQSSAHPEQGDPMDKRIAIGGLAAALVTTTLATSLAASAGAAGDDDPQGRRDARTNRAAATTSISCDGGRLLNMKSRIGNSPFTFGETAVNDEDQAVPGTGLVVRGPARGTDTVLVTFSAESQVTGGDANDWMGLEVHRNGSPINPFTPVGDVLAFTGEPSWNSNSTQFCTKITPGRHRFNVQANLHDSSGSHGLFGWLDDYTVSYLRFD
jgi:hypothetical protein